MNSFELLSTPVKKYIYEKGWDKLTPIQNASIEKITNTDLNYILCSRTASGKTEAALLPILSKIDLNEPGVQVLYIAPLIALINDQFNRVEEICENMDMHVTKWHGEASRALKNNVIKFPRGIVLITPESIESLFVNQPQNIIRLFQNLKFIVIDELHSFLGTKRGIQLKSLLFRLQDKINNKIRFVGLSATLGDYTEAKNYFMDDENTKILRDKSGKEVKATFKYYHSESDDVPLELLDQLYTDVNSKKCLIFPNSRGKVEYVSVGLKKQASNENTHQNYFAHHSSVSRELREFAENFAKKNKRDNYSIICTSTLELGIDIGSVDQICQIDSTFSVSSLAQRFGRSGRKEDIHATLLLYSTNPWSLLQSIACLELYKDGIIEPFEKVNFPIDILFHQILSILKETSGITKNDLINKIHSNTSFVNIELVDKLQLLDFMISEKFIEVIENELILGLKSERLTNYKEFYAVFESEDNYKVYYDNKLIGELQNIGLETTGSNIILGAKIWKIIDIDHSLKKVFVVTAKDGKKPKFMSNNPLVSGTIRFKMLEILYSKNSYEYLDEKSAIILNDLRRFFSIYQISNLNCQRPLFNKNNTTEFYTFSGTRINRTIAFLITHQFGIQFDMYNETESKIKIPVKLPEFNEQLKKMKNDLNNFSQLFTNYITITPNTPFLNYCGKWGKYLPEDLKIKLLLNDYFDVEGTNNFLTYLVI